MMTAEIMMRVAIKAPDDELFNTYQLPNRYMFLSSALDAAGCVTESIAALAMAAQCALESASPSSEKSKSYSQIRDDMAPMRILLFPENAVLDLEPHCTELADALAPIIKRLVRTYIDHGNSTTSESRCKSTSPIRENTLIDEVLALASTSSTMQRSHIRLSKLLDYVLWKQNRIDSAVPVAEKIIVVHDVLKFASKIAKSNTECDDALFMHFFEDMGNFINTQRKRFSDIYEPELVRNLVSTLHVTFAGQLIESRLLYLPKPTSWVLRQSSTTKRELKLLQLASIHLDLAETQLAAGGLNQCDAHAHDACYFARLSAVQLLHAIVSEHISLAEISNDTSHDPSIVSSFVKQIQACMRKYTRILGTCR
jgi:hypothetical protein